MQLYEYSSDININTNFDGYGICIKNLGKGGLSTVDLYRNNITGNEYAIKFINLFDESNDLSKQALYEISHLRRMKHPMILNIKGVIFSDESQIGIVLPCMDNNLSMMIDTPFSVYSSIRTRDGPLGPRTLEYMYQIILGLSYMHSRDIIHRDIKPHNILYDKKNSKMILADFGLTSSFNCANRNIMMTNVVTLIYKAPELLLQAQTYDKSIDIWSLGVTFFNMITGHDLLSYPNHYPDDLQLYYLGVFEELYGVELTLDNLYNLGYFQDTIDVHDKPPVLSKLINDILQPNPKLRPTIFDLQDHQLFNGFSTLNKYVDLKSIPYTCLENLLMRQSSPDINRFLDQKDINTKMRVILLDWMMAVLLSFRFSDRTFSYAHILLDTSIPNNMKRKNLQLFGTACLYISMVYNESYDPDISFFVDIAAESFTMKELKNTVVDILKIQQFDLVISTPIDFIHIYINKYYPLNDQLDTLSRLIYHIGIFIIDDIKYNNSQWALWSIYQACTYLEIPFLPNINEILPLKLSLTSLKTSKIHLNSVSKLFRKHKYNMYYVVNSILSKNRQLSRGSPTNNEIINGDFKNRK